MAWTRWRTPRRVCPPRCRREFQRRNTTEYAAEHRSGYAPTGPAPCRMADTDPHRPVAASSRARASALAIPQPQRAIEDDGWKWQQFEGTGVHRNRGAHTLWGHREPRSHPAPSQKRRMGCNSGRSVKKPLAPAMARATTSAAIPLRASGTPETRRAPWRRASPSCHILDLGRPLRFLALALLLQQQGLSSPIDGAAMVAGDRCCRPCSISSSPAIAHAERGGSAVRRCDKPPRPPRSAR